MFLCYDINIGGDPVKNKKIEDLWFQSTYTMEEYLKVLEYENIFGQHDKKIEVVKELLKNESLRNIMIV